jgi:hypothetical protein
MKSSIYATLVAILNLRAPETAELIVRMAADAMQQALNRTNWLQVKLLVSMRCISYDLYLIISLVEIL